MRKRKMKKKIVGLMLAVLMVVAVFAGCAAPTSSESGEQASAEPAASQEAPVSAEGEAKADGSGLRLSLIHI